MRPHSHPPRNKDHLGTEAGGRGSRMHSSLKKPKGVGPKLHNPETPTPQQKPLHLHSRTPYLAASEPQPASQGRKNPEHPSLAHSDLAASEPQTAWEDHPQTSKHRAMTCSGPEQGGGYTGGGRDAAAKPTSLPRSPMPSKNRKTPDRNQPRNLARTDTTSQPQSPSPP